MSEHIQPATDQRDAGPPPSEEHERTPGVSHESEAFDFRLIIWIGVGLAALCLLIQIALWWLLGGIEKRHAVRPGTVSELAKEDAQRPLGQRVDSIPGPHLEGMERKSDLSKIAEARMKAEAKMKRYGWTDPQKGIIHIPVEKAMEEVLRAKEFGPGNNKKKAAGGKR
jgi:hypothetical protein